MSNLISRQDVYCILEKMMVDRPLDSDRWVIRDIDKEIKSLPSVDRTRGKWVYHENDMLCVRWNKWECDQCHERVEYKYNFCPNCGADMRGEQDGRNKA